MHAPVGYVQDALGAEGRPAQFGASWVYFFFFLAALGFRCCARAFSSCGERELLLVSVRASHCCGFSYCGAWALGVQASVVVARGLSRCGMQALEHGLSSCGARA